MRIKHPLPFMIMLSLALAFLAVGCGEDDPEAPAHNQSHAPNNQSDDPIDCGPNEVQAGDNCECAAGYERVGDHCEEKTSDDDCGPHGEPHGNHCHCDLGFHEVDGLCEEIPHGDRALQVVESFQYPAGTLDGRAGGLGWAGEWAGSGSVQSRSLRRYDADNDRWTGYEGGALMPAGGGGAGGGGQATRRLDTHGLALSDTPGLVGAPGEELWISLVAYASEGQQEGQWGGLQLFGKGFRSEEDGGDHHDHDHGSGEDREWTEEVHFIGAPYQSSGRPTHWGLDRYPLDAPVYSDTPVDQVTHLLIRVEFGTDSDSDALVELWTDPPLSGSIGAADVSLPGPDFRIQSIRLAGFDGFVVDELRMGETLADVLSSREAEALHVGSDLEAEGTLEGQDDGWGWAGPWTGDASVVSWSDCTALEAACSELAVQGDGERNIDASWLRPEFSDSPGRVGAPGAQVWLAFLAHLPDGQSEDLRFAGLQLFDGTIEYRFLGAPWWDTDRPAHWGIDQPGEPTPTYTDTPTDQASRIVVAITFADEGETEAIVDMWVNPDSTPGEPDASLAGPDFRFDRIRLRGSAGTLFSMFRIAESFDDL